MSPPEKRIFLSGIIPSPFQAFLATPVIPPRQYYYSSKDVVCFCFVFVVVVVVVVVLQLYCPNRTSPTGNSGRLPRGKPATTESRYPSYGACWVFWCEIF